jgi:glycosyltransferase involved in cell wall biosynthesis
MKIIISHLTGNANVRNLVTYLYKTEILEKFYTSVAIFPNTFWANLAKTKLFNLLQRRRFDTELKAHTQSFPYKELGRIFSQKFNIKKLTAHEKGYFSVDKACKYLDRKVSEQIPKLNRTICGVYAYEDGALESFKKAKEYGLKCYYELPTAYWEFVQKILKEEAERLPLWANTLKGGIKDSPEKYSRKTEELNLADMVIVPSKFVADTLPKSILSSNKVIIAPFGSPPLKEKVEKKDTKLPLRILFVGSMGQNKGLADLFSAIKILNTNNIELITLGSLLAPIKFYRQQLSNFTYLGVQAHSKVLEIMGTCDIFCFPSIREGRALVMQEAMSQGLPIIITPNTGGEDLVIEGETGFLVPIRSPQAIAEKINWFIENKKMIPDMSAKAKKHAASYTWERYGEIIINSLRSNI